MQEKATTARRGTLMKKLHSKIGQLIIKRNFLAGRGEDKLPGPQSTARHLVDPPAAPTAVAGAFGPSTGRRRLQ
jgi:hypothetical protein